MAPETPLAVVAREMGAHKYGSAVIIRGAEVLGIFTTMDALQGAGHGAQRAGTAREQAPARRRRRSLARPPSPRLGRARSRPRRGAARRRPGRAPGRRPGAHGAERRPVEQGLAARSHRGRAGRLLLGGGSGACPPAGLGALGCTPTYSLRVPRRMSKSGWVTHQFEFWSRPMWWS